MTYVPVRDDERKGPAGRTPIEIPDALLAQLQHSRSTGDRCRIELTGAENPDDIAALRRALVRAGYRHFPDHTVNKRFRADHIEYWVGPKQGKAKGE